MTERSDLVRRACKAVVLRDARRWYKTRHPRTYVRSKETSASLTAPIRREIDALFAVQNEEWDEALKSWYERTYGGYGGDLRDLPWVGVTTLD